jgi:RimJ/RimL family protein N-acetyltransferase
MVRQHLFGAARSPRSHQGRPVLVRPVAQADAELLAEFLRRVSGRSRYQRYLSLWSLSGQALVHEVERIIRRESARDHVLLALAPQGDGMEVIAVAELRGGPHPDEAELAVMVRDDEQRRGLGATLVRQLIGIGRARSLARLHATMLAENHAMRRLIAGLDQAYRSETSYGATCVTIDLRPEPAVHRAA